jgi:predicted RNase H-like nuclease (RuvC/YqgF family)
MDTYSTPAACASETVGGDAVSAALADHASTIRATRRSSTRRPPTPARDDIGPASAGEVARRNARIDELQNDTHRLEIGTVGLRSENEELKAEVARLRGENIALKSEVRELKARLKSEKGPRNAPAGDRGDGGEELDIPDFLKRVPGTGHA